jgi:hypothetical protein
VEGGSWGRISGMQIAPFAGVVRSCIGRDLVFNMINPLA